METLALILPALDHNELLAALNLQEPYFHVAVMWSPRKFLRFVDPPLHYLYTVLPFGLPSTSCVSTKFPTVTAICQENRDSHLPLSGWLASEGQVQRPSSPSSPVHTMSLGLSGADFEQRKVHINSKIQNGVHWGPTRLSSRAFLSSRFRQFAAYVVSQIFTSQPPFGYAWHC